jgi:hypothetical protein
MYGCSELSAHIIIVAKLKADYVGQGRLGRCLSILSVASVDDHRGRCDAEIRRVLRAITQSSLCTHLGTLRLTFI